MSNNNTYLLKYSTNNNNYSSGDNKNVTKNITNTPNKNNYSNNINKNIINTPNKNNYSNNITKNNYYSNTPNKNNYYSNGSTSRNINNYYSDGYNYSNYLFDTNHINYQQQIQINTISKPVCVEGSDCCNKEPDHKKKYNHLYSRKKCSKGIKCDKINDYSHSHSHVHMLQ